MAKTTKDGLTIYDLDPQASELWVVAGPAGIDPKTIDTDNLPDGFRWVEAEEWAELQGNFAPVMAKRKPTDIRVYWDKQDRNNEGWAYNCWDDNGMIDSGALDSTTLEHAIEEACRILRMTGIEQDFVVGQEEGGYADWAASEEA